MNRAHVPKMRKINRVLLFFIPFLILFPAGCTQTQKVYHSLSKSVAKSVSKTIHRSKSKLKKRVLVLPVLDQAGLGQERAAQLTSNLAQLLMEDKKLLVRTASEPLPSVMSFTISNICRVPKRHGTHCPQHSR